MESAYFIIDPFKSSKILKAPSIMIYKPSLNKINFEHSIHILK